MPTRNLYTLSMLLFTLWYGMMISPRCDAHQLFQNEIPNGANVKRNGQSWPGVGHLAAAGGGARNPFGLAFAANGFTWSSALCQADSDGDGFTNGAELGDPNCVWSSGKTPSRTTDISHPGFSDSKPSTQSSSSTPSPPTTSAPMTPAPATATPPTAAPSTATPVTASPPVDVTPTPPTPSSAPAATIRNELSLFGGMFNYQWKILRTARHRQSPATDLLEFTMSITGNEWGGIGFAKTSGMTGPLIACYLPPSATSSAVCVDMQADASYIVTRRSSAVTTVISASRSGGVATITARVPLAAIGITTATQRVIFAHGTFDIVNQFPLKHSNTATDTVATQLNFYTGAYQQLKVSHHDTNITLIICCAVSVLIVLIGAAMNHCGFIPSVNLATLLAIFFALMILGAFLAVFAVSFKEYRRQGAPTPAGRAFGEALTYLFFMLLFPVQKHLGPLVGSSVERYVFIHPLIGTLLFIFMTVHFAMMADHYRSLGSSWLFSWSSDTIRPHLPGFLAWIFLVPMFITACLRNYLYTVFRYVHFLFPLVIIFACLHHKKLIFFLIPGLVFTALDFVLRFVTLHRAGAKLQSATYNDAADVTTLEVSVNNAADVRPGQYAFLSLSKINPIGHPFSISHADASRGILTFHIKAVGPYTRRIATLAREGKLALSMFIGPYGSLTVPLEKCSTIVLVAGGIGITPTASILSFLADPNTKRHPQLRRVLLVWTMRGRGMLQIPQLTQQLTDAQQQLGAACIQAEIRIFITGETQAKDCEMATEAPSAFPSSQISGRPDFYSIFAAERSAAIEKDGKDATLAAYICGPPPMMDASSAAASANNCLVHSEVFGF